MPTTVCIQRKSGISYSLAADDLSCRGKSINVDVNVNKTRRMTMNEIVDQIAARVGIPAEVAEKALGMMLGFLQREAADGPVARMIEAIPGASDLVAQYNGAGESGGGGLLGSIMGALGGGGIMALG